MKNFSREKIAVHDTGSVFSQFGWIFREQPIGDFGIDAIVELTKNNKPTGKLIAIQIKGGDGNFYRKNNKLTFYFSEAHYSYWKNLIMPVLIILQDSNRILRWQVFTDELVSKTKKKYKIEIPERNILENSKKPIELLFNLKSSSFSKKRFSPKTLNIVNIGDPHFNYFLDEKHSLNLIVQFQKKIYSLNLKYIPKQFWNEEESKLLYGDPNYFVLWSLERYVKDKLENLNNRPEEIFLEISNILGDDIENLGEALFNLENNKDDIPEYTEFISAFQKYFNLERSKFEPTIVGEHIYFKIDNNRYKLTTYFSRMKELRDYYDRRSYEEIYTQTELEVWEEVYSHPGILKHEFIPIFHKEWEIYWRDKYIEIRNHLGYTNHLDSSKEASLRTLENFTSLYESSPNPIKLAWDFDEMVLYPISVITMLNIYKSEDCFDEYCDYEFRWYDWKDISSLEEEDWDSPSFYLRKDE